MRRQRGSTFLALGALFQVAAGQSIARQPLSFVENRGQWETPARFVARAGETTARIEADSIWLQRRGVDRGTGAETIAVVALELAGGAGLLEPGDALPGVRSYFYGNVSERWVTGVRAFASVSYRDVAPGVDLVVHEGEVGLEYDLQAAPHADPAQVVFVVRGAEGLALGADGSLVVETRIGPLRLTAPVAWEEREDGVWQSVGARFRLLEGERLALEAPERDPSRALVIDPGIIWGTYLGGAENDDAHGVAVGPNGDVYVAGYTETQGFPTTPGAFDTTGGPAFGEADAFVTRFAADGATLVYSSYLGAFAKPDVAYDVVVDSSGQAIVVGNTSAQDFPLTVGVLDSTWGKQEGFVTKFSRDGTALVFSTFLGGSGYDGTSGVVLDEQDNVLVVGSTESVDFPTTLGAFQTVIGGGWDGFLSLISADGSTMLASTLFGGVFGDSVRDVSWNPASGFAFGGQTSSPDLPVTPGAVDPSFSSSYGDGYAARLADLNGPLAFCTYLSGSNGSSGVESVAQDSLGRVAVSGGTNSPDFPTTPGAFDTTLDAGQSGFISLLAADGKSFVYSTFFQASLGFGGMEALTLCSGVVTAGGFGGFGTVPTTPGAVQTPNAGAVLLRMHPSGSHLLYSGTLGFASVADFARTSTGEIAAAGYTTLGSFVATPGAFDTTYNGFDDAVVVKVDLLPTGVSRLGTGTPACLGPIWADVGSMPWAGNAEFSITCEGAPPSGVGALGIGFQVAPGGIPALNLTIYLNPVKIIVPLTTDAYGWSEVTLPLAASLPVGLQAWVQHVWINPPGCGLPGLLSASDALAITIQPPLP